jgi:hypothetical protein
MHDRDMAHDRSGGRRYSRKAAFDLARRALGPVTEASFEGALLS